MQRSSSDSARWRLVTGVEQDAERERIRRRKHRAEQLFLRRISPAASLQS